MEMILSVLIACLALSGVVWLFLLDRRHERQHHYRTHVMKEVTPLRLQAYERLTLYLDRIQPDNMALREQPNAASAKDLYLLMFNDVRQEFEHNVAMQIYVSEASWQRVVRAREEVVKTLKNTIDEVPPTVNPMEFAAEFIERGRNSCDFYVSRAKNGLRDDVQGLFVNQ